MTTEWETIKEKEWLHSGLKCKVLFVRESYRCGYVAVPEGHPAYGKGYDELDISVHGGLTYSEKGTEEGTWWFGFDCAHVGDRILELDGIINKSRLSESHSKDHLWTLEETEAETNDLAEQLSRLQEVQTLPREIREFLSEHTVEKITELRAQLIEGDNK